MNILHERLRDERIRLELKQDEFAEKGGVKARAQIRYESGERCPDGHYYAAIAAAGADVQYILTGVRSLNPACDTQNITRQLYLLKSSTEAIVPLKLDKYRAARLQSILHGVATGKGNDVAEAMADYANSELTVAEKDLLAAYRKASPADRTSMERLAQFAAKAAEDEAESGKSVNIEGEKHEQK